MSKKTYSQAQKAAMAARGRQMIADGHTAAAAAGAMGIAQSYLGKLLARDQAADEMPVASSRRIGRPRVLDLTAEERRVFQSAMLDCGYLPGAAKALMDHAETRPETRQVLGSVFARRAGTARAYSWPSALVEAAQLPEILEAWHRGRKHARVLEPKARRDGTIVMEDGSVVEWEPGWIYESDDMSLNEPYRFTDSLLRRETVGRQGLFTIDAAAQFHLQLDLCGRPFDAYRLEDIADHMLSVVETHGLPVFWRLEMGSWASNFVEGIKVPGMEGRWGGLRDLIYIRHKHESTGKANIERSFHEQQKLSAHASTSIGRERGEFETATKLFLRAQQGNADALRYFWTQPQAADAIAAILREENARVRSYRKLGDRIACPDELFLARIHKRPLRAADRWYFLPVKKRLTVRRQSIETKVANYARSFRFLTLGAEGFPVFAEGHPVLIAFHPGRPEEGCWVFNAATGAEAAGMRFGQFIGIAPLFRDTPEEILTATGDFGQLQKARAHVRAEYRTIVPAGTGPGTLKSIARDGLGNALAVQIGGNPAPAATSPRPAPDAAAAKAGGTVLPPIRAAIPSEAAWSSRAVPSTREARAAEIERLRAALAETE